MGNNCCCCKSSSGKHKSESNAYKSQTHLDPPTTATNPQQRPQTPVPPRNPKIVVAVYNYDARDSEEVSFDKGDRMEILDDSDRDWLFVRHSITSRRGYIPGNFVAPDLSVESEDWFFEKISRKEAEKLLLCDDKQSRGTFLIRPSEHNPHGYSLSVKDWNLDRGYLVKHYKIEVMDTGEYFISSKKPFNSLGELVEAYSKKNACGLCSVLTKPCRKPEPTMRDLARAYRDQWEIPREEIQLIRRLGKGNFGEVWYGTWKNQFKVAVKTLKKGTMSTEAFLQEGAIMKKFQHKRLVQLYGICSVGDIYLITEYMANGSLRDYLRKDRGQTLKFDDLVFIAYQVASGMAHLESINFIHRDLAARNVLVGNNKQIKICDFGLSRIIDDEIYIAQGGHFPLKWTAPEALMNQTFSTKSDVWSYGIFLMELFTFGNDPYEGLQAAVVSNWVLTKRTMAQPSKLPDEIYMVMKSCWSWEPENRPFFHQLEKYFEKMDISYRQNGAGKQIEIAHGVPNSYEDHELKN